MLPDNPARVSINASIPRSCMLPMIRGLPPTSTPSRKSRTQMSTVMTFDMNLIGLRRNAIPTATPESMTMATLNIMTNYYQLFSEIGVLLPLGIQQEFLVGYRIKCVLGRDEVLDVQLTVFLEGVCDDTPADQVIPSDSLEG